MKQDFENWYSKLMSLVEEIVPKVKIRDINSPPWIDGQVVHLLRKKMMLEIKLKRQTVITIIKNSVLFVVNARR